MDLRKGSDVKEGKRRCIRCRGRKQLYKTKGGWCFENSGGTLTDCPLCLGKGIIDLMPPKLEDAEEKLNAKKRTLKKIKEAHPKKIVLPHSEKEY